MSNLKLNTPDGYFEKSFGKTMASVQRINRRRKTLLGISAAVVLIAVSCFTVRSVRMEEAEKDFFAQQLEIARLDIFLEINQ